MSYSLETIFPSLPRTTRGTFTQLAADPKGKNFLYVNGNSVFIRSLSEPYTENDVYTEHSHQVSVARYSPSGFYIASADQTGKIRIWDTVNKEHLLKNEFQPISGCIKDLQWSSDNQRIVVGGEGREKFGHVFSADTGTSVGEIMGTSKPINSVDFKPTRPFRCVVGSEDNSVCYFEGPPFKWKRTISEHERFVNVVRYAPNGEKFATGGADGRLFIFDGKNGDKLYELSPNGGQQPAHAGSIFSLAWDPTSQLILTVSGDKTAKIWDVEQKSLQKEFKFGDTIEDQQVGCLWQNNYVLTLSLSGQINYLNRNAASGSSPSEFLDRVLKGHSKSITALDAVHFVSGETPLLFSGSHEGLIVHWNSSTGQMNTIGTHSGVSQHKNLVQAIRFDSANDQLVSCGLDDVMKFISLKELKYTSEIKLDSQPQGLDVDLNGLIAVACVNKLIVFKNTERVASIALNYEANCVTISRRGEIIAVGGKDNKAHVYQFKQADKSLSEVKTLNERDFITAIRFSNNDEYLAVADNAKNVKCYKMPDYTDITNNLWQYHAGRITGMSWSPDSSRLATTGVDTHCFVYTPNKVNQVLQIKNAHPLNPLTACAWLDSTRLVTASQDCCLRKWRIN